MPTLKKRTNITLDSSLDELLSLLAIRDDVPKATKAADLIKMALEIEEDDLWNAIVEKRDIKGAKFLSHDETWS